MLWTRHFFAVAIAAMSSIPRIHAANIYLGDTPPGDAAAWLRVGLARDVAEPAGFGVKSDGGNRFLAVHPAETFWLLRADGGFTMHDNLHGLAETSHPIDMGLAALTITVGELATEGDQVVQHFAYDPGGPLTLPVAGFLPEPNARLLAVVALAALAACRKVGA